MADLPGKLAARLRMLDTRRRPNADPHGAHSVAVAAAAAKQLGGRSADPRKPF